MLSYLFKEQKTLKKIMPGVDGIKFVHIFFPNKVHVHGADG